MAKRSLASLHGGVAEAPDPTKGGPEQKVDRIDRKMTFSERQSLAYEIEMMERSINQNLNKEKDDPKVMRQLYYKKMLLAKDDELTLSGNAKELAYKELKEIEDVIVKKMPSKNEMWPKNDISLKAQALRHQQAFEAEFDNFRPDAPATGGMVKRWQELKRRLEPDNPNAHNLDSIRPD